MAEEKAPDELIKSRLDSLVELHAALEKFGIAWEGTFTNEERQQCYEATRLFCSVEKLVLLTTNSFIAAYALSAILAANLENAMAHYSNLPK